MKKIFQNFNTLLFLIILFFISVPSSCQETDPVQNPNDTIPTPIDTNHNAMFAKGADVSWLTEMESAEKKFYNAEGKEMECMSLLKSLGINAIRLRVWVNPANGWCNAADMLVKARRANDLGLRLMIDFHYSDSWADPGKQTKPSAWNNLSFEELKSAVSNHTTEVLTLLKDNGITPEWVQVGNETGNGMLWETGKASTNMGNYAALTTAGYNATKAVFPNAKVIVHLQNGYDNSLFRWIFDGLKNNGGKWDVVGMSLYPNWYTTPNDWSNANKACLANMNDMVTRYGKEVMIVECGMSWDNAAASYSFLTDLIAKTKSVLNGKGLGVFYWEPQSYGQWKGYTLGAFDNNGKPTIAMNAFLTSTKKEIVKSNNITYSINRITKELKFSTKIKEVTIFSTDGRIVFNGVNSDIFRLNNIYSGNFIMSYFQEETNNFKVDRIFF